eukprot:gnl/TRDRNA2_/TRDRNA2_170739_c1_seq1.p1 gnl/TRDRNA2_/TRDRNA2_170739_c1~~gnl/TRDRNA2_/TRDRNA2_170739_c1_seq1.p1  ORF type:complete len:179 (+),score=30.84 gnl/TRDRNA2_/TRDRNA2_170739_c1_seq1:52-588(+)
MLSRIPGMPIAQLFMSLKYGTGDVIVQQTAITVKGGEFDTRRAAMFYGFGGYYGMWFYGLCKILDRLPNTNPWAKAVFSACFDGFVHVPLWFFPQFYTFKEWVTSTEPRSFSDHASVGIEKWQANWRGDVLASAGVFIPLGIFNFRFVPLRWRVPFLSTTSIIFPIILSTTRGKSDYD